MARIAKNKLAVRPLRLSSGETCFEVFGWLLGTRIRKRFPTKADAEGFAFTERAKNVTSSHISRQTVTVLSEEQQADAERARTLLPSHASLTEAARFYVQHFKPVAAHPLREALVLYLHEKLHEAKNRQYTVDRTESMLNVFIRESGAVSTADISTELERKWVFAPEVAVRTQRDRYDHLGRFNRWLMTKHWLLTNPMADVRRPDVEYGPPSIFSVEEVQRILTTAWTDPTGPNMLPFFAVCLLSGARPFEVRGAKEENFFIEESEGDPIFEVWKSKTPWRTVELTQPLLGILRECKNRGINLAYFYKGKFDRIRRDAGVFKSWDNDIQRHTFASYHYALHRDINTLEKNLGTSERVLFTHYIRRTVRKSEAQAFTRIAIDWTAPPRKMPTPAATP